MKCPFFLRSTPEQATFFMGMSGTEDYTLDPLIRPGAFVQIDPHQNKVIKGVWPSEHDRPVYFVELRDDRYACSWCDHEGSRLLLGPIAQIASADPLSSLSSGRRDRRPRYGNCDADC